MNEPMLAAHENLRRIVAAWPHPWRLTDGLLFAGYVGSTSHGTKALSADGLDDVDVMATVIPPPRYVLGASDSFDHWCPPLDPEGQGPLGNVDVVVYSLRKLVGLLLKGNPNVIGLLWLPQRCWLCSQPEWDRLVAHRGAFLSERVVEAHAGYAAGQLQRLWRPNSRGYMGRERKALFKRFGYDPKNAAHLVRLLRMGCELAETGELNVDRSAIDAPELVAIKRGEWTLQHIEREAEAGFARLHAARALKNLPPRPDAELANEILVELTLQRWGRR